MITLGNRQPAVPPAEPAGSDVRACSGGPSRGRVCLPRLNGMPLVGHRLGIRIRTRTRCMTAPAGRPPEPCPARRQQPKTGRQTSTLAGVIVVGQAVPWCSSRDINEPFGRDITWRAEVRRAKCGRSDRHNNDRNRAAGQLKSTRRRAGFSPHPHHGPGAAHAKFPQPLIEDLRSGVGGKVIVSVGVHLHLSIRRIRAIPGSKMAQQGSGRRVPS